MRGRDTWLYVCLHTGVMLRSRSHIYVGLAGRLLCGCGCGYGHTSACSCGVICFHSFLQPFLRDEVRQEICSAAVRAAHAVGYVGAGLCVCVCVCVCVVSPVFNHILLPPPPQLNRHCRVHHGRPAGLLLHGDEHPAAGGAPHH